MSEHVAPANVMSQTSDQGGVLFKLIVFTAALAFAPLSSYFLSKQYIWNGNSTYAAITAIVAANAVLVAYIFVSLREEQKLTKTSPKGEVKETKKTK